VYLVLDRTSLFYSYKTYRKCLCSNIVVKRDINGKVGIADSVSKKIWSFTLSVVLTEELIVWRSVLFLVIRIEALEVGYPLNLVTQSASSYERRSH
jgi:hypothetical protein